MHKILEKYVQHFRGLYANFLQNMLQLCMTFTQLLITLLVHKH